MKKTLFKTDIGLFILLAFLLVFTSRNSFAGSINDPLCDVMVGRNGTPKLVRDLVGKWTHPVLVFSNKKSNVYTGDDTITGNLFHGNVYGDFLGNGNFVAQLYFEIKDKNLRKTIIETLKSDIAKNPSLAMTGHPDLFTYAVYYAFFDMKNNIVSIQKWNKYLDRDGDLIMVKNEQGNIPLDNNSDFKEIAHGIISVLDKAKNDPKIAVRIRKMQEHGNNMTAVSSHNALRNLEAVREQNRQNLHNRAGLSRPMDKRKDDPEGLTALDWYNKAFTLINNVEIKDPQKVIGYLNEAIRLKPDCAEAYYCRGFVYSIQEQYKRAITDYDEAVRLKPDLLEVYNQRGLAYNKIGQHQKAITDFDKVIRLKPNAEAYATRGAVYIKQKQYQLAIIDYNEAIRLKPDYAAAYNDRGYAYNNLGQYQRAITDLNEAIRLKPDYPNPYRHRGNSSRNLGQYQRAIKDYDEAVRLKPDYAAAYDDRGLAYILAGNIQEGCRSLVRACELGNCEGYNLSKQKSDCR